MTKELFEHTERMNIWRDRSKDFRDRVDALRPPDFTYRHMGMEYYKAVLGKFVDPVSLHASCLSCLHFDKQNELCKAAKPPQRPPATIIVRGCPAYDDEDEIPF